jgi:ParG
MIDPDDLTDLHSAAAAVQEALGVLVERLEVLLPETEPDSEPVPDAERFKAAAPAEPTRQLTVDLPESLHTRIKLACAANHQNMADAVRALLDEHWPEDA